MHEYDLVFTGSNFIRDKILPQSGGWADQPYKLMKLIDIVNNERSKP